ncbi:hypothetical protein RRG08_043475 [Elysia crispata]|uniref:LolA-like domain-containing protein n=1 Tax=Elysia crispata TaxID=231223 RepID=A0AAE1CYG8_9GAST|nr:hypothetical protein RRG08_043475 [Elysia crispata]
MKYLFVWFLFLTSNASFEQSNQLSTCRLDLRAARLPDLNLETRSVLIFGRPKMGSNLFSVTLFLLSTCLVIRPGTADEAQDRFDICGDISPNVDNATAEFTFESQFKAHVEAAVPDLERVINAWMVFSSSQKTLKVALTSTDLDYALYEDYEHHQSLFYNFQGGGRGTCYVDHTMRDGSGVNLIPEPPEEGHIPSVSQVLRLTGKSGFENEEIKLQKGKTTKYRSLGARPYYSCQKIKTTDNSEAIVKVTHLVSNAKLARTESGTVPLQVKFEGKYVSGNQAQDDQGNRINRPLTHVYNFFHYSTSVADDELQTPKGIVCPDRKGPNSFPKPPLYVRFGQEVHDSESTQVTTIKTTYDKEFNFVSEEFFDLLPGKQSRLRFDDFYAGLSYDIDYKTGACFATNISQVTQVNDYAQDKNGKIKMMTPEQFWDAEGVEYHYNGKKHFRGLETEVWIGKDPNTGYMYEWYFTFGIQHTVNDDAKSEQKEPHRVPYKRIFWPDNTNKYYSNYYFQVDFTEPPLLMDLSPCYQKKKQLISLSVSGLTLERVVKDETLVLRRAVTTLSKELKIPFTRISHPQVAFKAGKGYILFDLLGPPKYSSDLITQHTNQPGLDEVVSTLKKLTDDRNLVFEVGNKEVFVKGEAKFEEFAFKPPKRTDRGYSPGAMAGLSVAMVVVGVAAGGGGGYWFIIRQ